MSGDVDTLVETGCKRTIRYAVRRTGEIPAKEFIEGLGAGDVRKLGTLFEMMCEMGQITNPEKFKLLDGKLYEFKSFQIRIPCFRKESTWYLTHGFFKKKDKVDHSEIKRGHDIMAEHR